MQPAYIDIRFIAYNVSAYQAKEIGERLAATIEAAYRLENLLNEF